MTGIKVKTWLFAVAATALILIAASVFSGCDNKSVSETASKETQKAEGQMKFENQSLVISGSTTLLEVSEAWAEAFMAEYGGEITVNGGGSGVGIADMINRTNDLANSSRKIKDEEADQAKSSGIDLKEYMVLYDGIAVIVSKNISVDVLSIQQLSDIFTGKITNWKEFGGPDSSIVAAARDSSSGTGEYFLEEVVQIGKTIEDNDYGDTVLRLQSNADVANQVSENENCIGYIGLGYLKSVSGKANIVKVKENDSSEAIEPDKITVKDKSYPIARDLYVYADGNNMSDIVTAFVDFMLGNEGQAIGEDSGFVSIK